MGLIKDRTTVATAIETGLQIQVFGAGHVIDSPGVKPEAVYTCVDSVWQGDAGKALDAAGQAELNQHLGIYVPDLNAAPAEPAPAE